MVGFRTYRHLRRHPRNSSTCCISRSCKHYRFALHGSSRCLICRKCFSRWQSGPRQRSLGLEVRPDFSFIRFVCHVGLHSLLDGKSRVGGSFVHPRRNGHLLHQECHVDHVDVLVGRYHTRGAKRKCERSGQAVTGIYCHHCMLLCLRIASCFVARIH